MKNKNNIYYGEYLMRTFNILFLVTILLPLLLCNTVSYSKDTISNTIPDISRDASQVYAENILKEKLESNKNIKTFSFNYKDANLIDVIYSIAAEKKVNIVLPTGDDAIKSKLTISISEKLTVDQAWETLYTILDIAGYSFVPRADGFSIVRVSKAISREPFRIFISTDYEHIPDTDERIIYLAYFTNIQVPSGQSDGQNQIQKLLKTYVSKEAESSFKFAPSSNGVIIVDKANNIRAIMKILTAFDKVGVTEILDIIKLKYTFSDSIADLFNKNILEKTKKRGYRLGTKKKSEASYFEKGTKVISEPRTNSLILLGSEDAIEKIKVFIHDFVDITIGSGRSILHRRKLDYMDANKLKDVLISVIGGGANGGQATAGAGRFGPERFFSGVKIETDYPKQEGEAEKGKYKYYGTNSLIIAANNDDWLRIDELIEQLDKPQPQVVIEVLIVDLRLDENKALGGQTRNPALAPLMRLSREGRGVDFQSAQLGGRVISDTASQAVVTEGCNECFACGEEGTPNSQTIAADLMKDIVKEKTGNGFLIGATPGSTLFTLSDRDGRTWSVLKVLSLYKNAKVLSHPYIVARNNKEATVVVGIEKLLAGEAEGSAGGAVRVKTEKVKADTIVKIRPRIAEENMVNIEVTITINEFADETTAVAGGAEPRVIREISTNANIRSGEILSLGGLIRVENSNSESRSPILGRIPVLGWFFKQKSKARKKDNLTVFIRPTIVYPTARKAMSSYTNDYIQMAKEYSREGGLFEGLKDPITRWFFGAETETIDLIEDFVEQHERVIPLEELKIAKAPDVPDVSGNKFVVTQNDLDAKIQKQEQEQDKVMLANNNTSDISSEDTNKDTHKASGEIINETITVTDLSEQKPLELKLEAIEDASKDKQVANHDRLRSLLQGANNPFVS